MSLHENSYSHSSQDSGFDGLPGVGLHKNSRRLSEFFNALHDVQGIFSRASSNSSMNDQGNCGDLGQAQVLFFGQWMLCRDEQNDPLLAKRQVLQVGRERRV